MVELKAFIREYFIDLFLKLTVLRPNSWSFIHRNSYDEAVGLPTTETARVARNTQLILQEETGITDVIDPWGGSFMMESLTDEIYMKAMNVINEVESMGGMTSYISSGMAKMRIEESATKKQARIDTGKKG